MEQVVLLTILIFAAAILYSSVGHAGASGYLAAMALVGVAPDVMKPTALALNILVASIATTKYYRAGYFSWSALWPFRLRLDPAVVRGRRYHSPRLPLQTRRRTCPVLRRLPTVSLHYGRNARGHRQRHQHPNPASGGLGRSDRPA